MDQLKLLGVALGLACLAGINLYLTVFVTGLAIHQHWIVLDPAYRSLAILGDPVIIWVSGILYGLEFFADKIPWIDSAWDTVHTLIRPIGGALLAIRTLGNPGPVFDVIVALAAGGSSLVTHTAKASTRLAANTSPEPFSNIGLSLAEDALVVGGLALIHVNPVLALGICIVLVSTILYFVPKIFRAVRVKIWLIWKKLNRPPDGEISHALPAALPSRYAAAFARQNLLGESVAWAVPCVAKKLRGIGANVSGLLVATREDPRKLIFLARKSWRSIGTTIELEGYRARRVPKFLSENLLLAPESEKGPRYLFLFERSRRDWVQQIADDLNARPAAAPSEPVSA